MKIKYGTLLMILSFTLMSITMTNSLGFMDSTNTLKSSALPSKKVSILVYTEYRDTTWEGFENTMDSLEKYYNNFYTYDNLTDYSDLHSTISNYDVLLIPEQQSATYSQSKTIGQNWTSSISGFVSNGGVVVCLDFNGGWGYTRLILNSSGIMEFSGGVTNVVGSTIYLSNIPNALSRDISSSWTAPSGTISVSTTDGTKVVEDGSGNPIVVHKYLDQGHVVYCGFDFYNIEQNCGKILANAIRLAYVPHIIFDASHSNIYGISGNFQGLAMDLVDIGYDVSSMTTLGEGYFNYSDVLVLTVGYTNYTKSDVDVIENYVDKGKGLLLCTDRGTTWSALDGVLKRFGFERNKTECVLDSDEYTSQTRWPIFAGDNIKPHEITMGVIDVEMYATAAFITIPSKAEVLIATDDDSTSTWETSGTPAKNLPIAAELETSKGGRIVACGEVGLLRSTDDTDGDGTSDYNDRSNGLFLRSSIRWLLEASTDGSSSSEAIPGFPLEIMFLTVMISCAAMLIFIYKKRT